MLVSSLREYNFQHAAPGLTTMIPPFDTVTSIVAQSSTVLPVAILAVFVLLYIGLRFGDAAQGRPSTPVDILYDILIVVMVLAFTILSL